jgi:endoglucanase
MVVPALALVVSPLPIAASASAPRAASAFVRVDQLGYPVDASKRAYLMSAVAEGGATFVVHGADGDVFSAGIGGDLGSWSSDFPHVYPLDFDGLATPGRYTIQVTGAASVTSLPFTVGTGSDVYGGALRKALRFYQVQRDGRRYIPSRLRTAPSHLNDAHAMTYRTPDVTSSGHFDGDLHPLGTRIDAEGGWWDAGDYLKFVHATSYTDAMLLSGVRDFPGQMGTGAAANGSDFTDEARFGARWLLKMWDDPSRTLYYQVGIGNGNRQTVSDHDIWRLPQADDDYGHGDPAYRYIRHRPVFRAGPPGSPISPNLAGRDAAALALCFQVFSETAPNLAERCLVAAEHIFELADTTPHGHLLTAIPFDFYPEDEWRDDLELGATELSLAVAAGGLPDGLPHTDADFYLGRAAHWAHEYIDGPNDAADTLNLYDVTGLAHYDLVRAITQAGDPGGLQVTTGRLLDDMRTALDGALAQGATDPFGFGFPWGVWDTTTHGAGLSIMASEVDELSGNDTYAGVADRWLGNILGANAWGTSLIVGDGTVFPHCIQHQVANIAGSLDGTPPLLAGAAVEGTNHHAVHGSLPRMRACPPSGIDRFARFNGQDAVWRDNVESYATTEPAIDLTVTTPLAFARQVAGIR